MTSSARPVADGPANRVRRPAPASLRDVVDPSRGGGALRPERTRPAALAALADRSPALTLVFPHAAGHQGTRFSGITGVTLDSRAVRPGDLYAALPGARVHGASFVASAVAAGAVAVLTDATGAHAAAVAGVPALVADDPRSVLGDVSAAVYGDPSRALRLLGVTGTNGKTTVCYLLDAGLRAAGHRTGLVGTVETRVAGNAVPSARTTPEAPDLQALLAVMVEQGVTATAMEVSSHALALHRVDACAFAVGGFTNLSQDHLDFHPTMADYLDAKAQLFDPGRSARAVLDVDDEAGRTLLGRRPDAVTVGVPGSVGGAGPDGPALDLAAVDVRLRPDGSSFRLVGAAAGAGRDVTLRLPGAFNISNAVVALAMLVEASIDLDAAISGVAGLAGVPGRMQRIDVGQPWFGVVDYAHTPAAVTTLLSTVRGVTAGRVVVVLGCGGDRDRGKRPLMGAAAAQGADLVVLTSDNPRSEDPDAILAAMLEGVAPDDRSRVRVEPDRAAGIALAVSLAGPGDAVVVAGKGHETGQDVAGTVTPFDDRDVLAAVALDSAARDLAAHDSAGHDSAAHDGAARP